jgi:hypothetical protein
MTFDSFKLKKRCEPFRRQQRWIIRRFRGFPCRLLRLPKRIALKSNIRLSGVLVKASSKKQPFAVAPIAPQQQQLAVTLHRVAAFVSRSVMVL